MIEPRNSTKRYMDFVGPRQCSATDPLISRPVARKPSATKNTKNTKSSRTPSIKTETSAFANLHDPLAQKSRAIKPAEPTFPTTATPRSRLFRAPIRPVSSSRPTVQNFGAKAPAAQPLAAKTSAIQSSVSKTPAVKSSSKSISVKKTSERALVSRKPSVVTKEYYPTKPGETPKPVVKKDSLSLIDSALAEHSAEKTTSIKTTDHPHDDLAKKAAGALSGSSPFLTNYNIDKRPLSSSVPDKKSKEPFEKVSYLGVNDSPVSSPRRDKISNTEAEDELIDQKERQPVKIIDRDKSSALPLAVVIILTIILGAAAGAGVYFLVAR